MAKRFISRIALILLAFGLLAGVITAQDNTRSALTGIRSPKTTWQDIEYLIKDYFKPQI